jgi:hypothetical protein
VRRLVVGRGAGIPDGRNMTTWHRRYQVLAEVTYAVVALRRSMGKRGPDTECSPVRAAAVSPVVESRCEATCAARRCSVRACRERWPERRQRRGDEGPAASTGADVEA